MRRKRAEYFWDEDYWNKNFKSIYDRYKRKPILFARHKNGVIVPVFEGPKPKQGKYTGEVLRAIRAKDIQNG